MRSRTVWRAAWALTLLGLQPLFVRTAHAQAPSTDMKDVFMYGIDADTFELLRYNLSTDEFVSVGVVRDEMGNIVKDVEAMAYIPYGPRKGFYGVTNFHDKNPSRLVKINPLDASAEVSNPPIGFWKVTGLIAYQDPGNGQWSLIGATKNTNKADLQAKLISINPDNGQGTEIMDLGIMMMAGLALDASGTLYGVDRGLGLAGEVPPGTDSDLYIIDPWSAPQTLTHVGPLPWKGRGSGIRLRRKGAADRLFDRARRGPDLDHQRRALRFQRPVRHAHDHQSSHWCGGAVSRFLHDRGLRGAGLRHHGQRPSLRGAEEL
ncbi:MAG: hypothetical protein IH888_12245 [Planctomycetes bacterium]|nr:hypothetical protein [Planctomycetota bacterium]